MARHIADHRRKSERPARAAEYLRIERQAGPHPSALALHRRKSGAATPSRLKAYTRIERGQNV